MIEGIMQNVGMATIKPATPERTKGTQDLGAVFASKLREARSINAKANEGPQIVSADRPKVNAEGVNQNKGVNEAEAKKATEKEADVEAPVTEEESKEENKSVEAALFLLNGLMEFLTQGENIDPEVEEILQGIEAKIEELTANGAVELSDLVEEVTTLLNQIPENAEGEEALTQFLSFLEGNAETLTDGDAQVLLNQVKDLMNSKEQSEGVEVKEILANGINLQPLEGKAPKVTGIQQQASQEKLPQEEIAAVESMGNQGEQQVAVVKDTKKSKHSEDQPQDNEEMNTTQETSKPFEGIQVSLKNQVSTPKEVEPAPMNTPEVKATEVIQQIVQRAELDIKEGKSEIRIHLMPEHLGDVLVKITMEKGNLSAKVITENAQVKELIDQNLDQLRINLGEKGINVSSLEVSVDQNPHAFGRNETYSQYKARLKTFRNTGVRVEGVGVAYQETSPAQNPYQVTSNFDALA